MELKKYVRRGQFDECHDYRTLLTYHHAPPGVIVVLLEGKARRKTTLSPERTLYENYYPTSFIGLADHILQRSRPGAVGVYPGSHYVLWNADDFLNAAGIQPELARRAIFELSRRIRIYDSHKRSTDAMLRVERDIEVGSPEEELRDDLYEMSFADEDDFPPEIVAKLSRKFSRGDFLMRQGEQSTELYIVISGLVRILQKDETGNEITIDELEVGDMVGEMAQFDGMPRSASARAEGDVQALEFKPENFHLLFMLHPKWAQKLMNTLAERLELRLEGFVSANLATLQTEE